MGGFASKSDVLAKALREVLQRGKVHEEALKSRVESLQIVIDTLEEQRVNPAEVNEVVVSMIDKGLIPAIMQSLEDLQLLDESDEVADNVSLNVHTLMTLGKFVESQEQMDTLGIADTLSKKVLQRYMFDAALARDIKRAASTIRNVKEAESGKMESLYSSRVVELKKKRDAVGLLTMMAQGEKLEPVQKLGVKALYEVLDKKDNKAKLSQSAHLRQLLKLLIAHEGNSIISFTGLVLLTEIAADLPDGDLSDLGKNSGCSFAVKQLYMHQVSALVGTKLCVFRILRALGTLADACTCVGAAVRVRRTSGAKRGPLPAGILVHQ